MNRIRVTPTPLTLVFEMSKADSRALARRDGIFHTFQHVGRQRIHDRDRVMYACITYTRDSLERSMWKMLIWNASNGFLEKTSIHFFRPLLSLHFFFASRKISLSVKIESSRFIFVNFIFRLAELCFLLYLFFNFVESWKCVGEAGK